MIKFYAKDYDLMIKCADSMKKYLCLTRWYKYNYDCKKDCNKCSEFQGCEYIASCSGISEEFFKTLIKLFKIIENKGKECKR